jgi:hypothetical protein
MPLLPELLGQLQFISYETALFGLFVTAGAILINRDWRLLILALLLQYILAGLILSRFVQAEIAVLQVMIGAFICPILFLSVRQVSVDIASAGVLAVPAEDRAWFDRFLDWAEKIFIVADDRRPKVASTSPWFRGGLALLLVLVSITLSRSFPLPQLPGPITTAIYWLGLAGLGTLTVTEDPLKVGLGLFTLFTGFGLYYQVIETSLLLTGLWGTANLLLALAVGYLAVVWGTGPEEEL